MKVVACVKTAAGSALSTGDAFDRAGRVGPAVLAGHDRHAVEEALRLVESAGDGEAVVLAVGSAECVGAVKEALAMGCHRAVIVSDPHWHELDLLAASRLVAGALRREAPDMALHAPWSGDIDGSLLWSMVAQRLGVPTLSQARTLSVADGFATASRQVEGGDITVTASLPCLVDVTEAINKPRYASLKSKQAAKNKPLELLTSADIDPEMNRATGIQVTARESAPVRRRPEVVKFDSTTAKLFAAFLEQRGLL
jgi:electron transfer flavoprotein beta subunit